MSEHELDKLLGGFAADTLTQEERQKLFSAALQDQQLFNALADEQALKELLADPAVRRRLLQALRQTATSGTGGSLSWLDWFRRPASLAFAGGLAVAVLAVVLGTKVYQEGLRQAAQSVATEDTKPASPPAPAPAADEPPPSQTDEPQAKAKENAAPVTDFAKTDAMADKLVKRERSAPSAPQGRRASDATHEIAMEQPEEYEGRKQAEAPAAGPGETAEEGAASADLKQRVRPAPQAAATEPKSAQADNDSPAADSAAPIVSARALFYGRESAHPDSGMMAQEKQRATQPLAESAPRAGRLERKTDGFALGGKAGRLVAQVKPLGLRYSFIVRGADGQDREVDAATAVKRSGSVRLTVEANQDSYLQIWKTGAASTPQLLFPAKESGQISLKILAGQRQDIPLPVEREAVTVRLSRVPFGPITRQEAALFDRSSPNQLEEAVVPSGSTGSPEEANYVVNRDPSAAELLVAVVLLK